MLALGEGLRSLGKSVRLFNETGVPPLYKFLPHAKEVATRLDAWNDFDIAVLLDCHSLKRAGKKAAKAALIQDLAILDHHEVGQPVLSAASMIDPEVSATGELIYQLLISMEVDITPQMATNLFTAISTDTGSFSFDNTTASCLDVAAALVRRGARPWEIFRQLNFNMPPQRLNLLSRSLENIEYYHQGRIGTLTVNSEVMAATKTSKIDTEGFVSYPRSVRGVELALLITENGDGVCHVSLRSQGKVDAAALAGTFGGGGHHNAAGFSLAGTVEEVKTRVISAAISFLPPEGA
ncbi:MAG: DHH family phosphoesterase [Deltaproteobacteria bacterium]|nr:DHH family phosphoesterase [Deltaproteobacteria bacterium]